MPRAPGGRKGGPPCEFDQVDTGGRGEISRSIEWELLTPEIVEPRLRHTIALCTSKPLRKLSFVRRQERFPTFFFFLTGLVSR